MEEMFRTVKVYYCEVHAGYPNDDWVAVTLSKNGYGKVLLKYDLPEIQAWQHEMFIGRLKEVLSKFAPTAIKESGEL